MATNPRIEISSGSPENTTFGYLNSHRGHYSTGVGGPNLERVCSFRESHDGGGRASTPGGAGSNFANPGSTITHGELPPLSQVLSLECIATGEQKYAKQLELRKATAAAMALTGDVQGGLQPKPIEHQGPEELKRIKASLNDNISRARERSRALSEAVTKLDKYRASLQSRKRARAEAHAHERPLTSVSGERTVPSNATSTSTISTSKANFCASPSHNSIGEGGVPKPEDKSKGLVPNKRVRTSMLDVRLEGRASMPSFQRASSLADRDRESMKPGSSLGGLPDEKDRLVAPSGEAWEKTKIKGRRSTPKSDCVIATAAGGVSELEREHKWGLQHRSNAENRPRSTEGHSYSRSGPVHGVVSIHKSAIRIEPDNAIPVGEKEARFAFADKERQTPTLKSGVKMSHKEQDTLLSPTTVAKAKVARAPRSGPGNPVNPASVHAPRPPSAEAWDRTAAAPAALNRAQIPVGPSNRKRPAPTRSSSPPVTQWVGQRPQKMSRVARRMNIAPPVGPTGVVREESIPSAEAGPVREPSVTPTGVRSTPSTSPIAGLVKRVTSTTGPAQIKSKPERIASPAGLSESEDSEGGDVKSKEKWKKHADSEGRFAAVNQKMAPLFSQGKKSRVGPKEEGVDGIRRQGRSGRALIAVRESPNVTLIEKGDPSANAKQLRSARPGVDKMEKQAEVKPGRPPTKKGGIGDRKALTRPRRPAINGGSEVSGESDDDREEVAAAVQAAVNASATASSSMFWKEIEPFFAYLTPDARNSLRIQVTARELEYEELLPSLISDSIAGKTQNTPLDSPRAGKASYLANGAIDGHGSTGPKVLKLKNDKILGGIKGGLHGGCPVELPLSQRLLAALIIEGDLDDDSREDRSQLELQGYVGDGSSHDLSDSEHGGAEKDQESESEVETRKGNNGNLNGWLKSSPYDVSYTSNGHRYWDSESELLNSPAKSEPRKEEEKQFSDINGQSKWDGKYQNLTLDERIALELQSIGLYPDQGELVVREDDQIFEELRKSQLELKELVHKNKERLSSLEKVVSSSRANEEREREQLGMIKLLESAFSKRLGTRGGHLGISGGSKNSASKAGRAAAVTVAKRSLGRWKHFLETGESCFTEAGLREVLLCISSKDSDMKALMGEMRAGINSLGLTLTGSPELKLAASAGIQWVCNALNTRKADKDSCESDRLAVGTPSERTGDKDDVWCTRSKEREVLLEDVGGSGSGGSVLFGTKGKRTERERDAGNGKGGGRQGGLGTIKGERKTKTKPRQKTAPLLKAVNGLLGKPSELPEKPAGRVKQEAMGVGLGGVDVQPEGEGTIDLSHLQLPGMDDLVVNGDLGGQGQDLGSWLDFDDPGLPDAGGDFMGLDVPMDDLADLSMIM